MRNLIITRNKSFVGALAKMKVYVEAPEAPEIFINNVPCRKLGTLKNGETATFSIGEHPQRIFVIADKLSRGYCSEFAPLRAGTEDVILSGQCRYNPLAGNAFRFDGTPTREMEEHRRKGTSRGLIIFCIVLAVSVLLGLCVGVLGVLGSLFGKASPETFTIDELSITLTNDFEEIVEEGEVVGFSTDTVAVFVYEKEYDSNPGLENYTLHEFGYLLLDTCEADPSVELKKDGDFEYFEMALPNTQTGQDMTYFTVFFKTDTAFWIVEYYTPTENMEDFRTLFLRWSRTVELAD